MTGNPLQPSSRWEAVKFLFAVVVLLPIYSVRDYIKDKFKKKDK